ncbi:MAG TPA: hypothetical protein VFZ34_04085, partial [Blastocatellia bacterium]|nr:hypothetical protein [Blastocatellia bacterium]
MIRAVLLLLFAFLATGCHSNLSADDSQDINSPTPQLSPSIKLTPYVPDTFSEGLGSEVFLEKKEVFTHLGYTARINIRRVSVPHLRSEREVYYATIE